MYLSWLTLRDMRCYDELDFRPEPGVNVLVGDNGVGKTSVLEAIAYVGMLKSFRGVPDSALVRAGASASIVRAGIGGAATETTVEIETPLEGRRTVLVNGKRPARMRDLLATVPVVAFLPDDLDVIKRGPAIRREYLDDLAASLWPQASADLSEYDRILRQRNTLLRQEGRRTDPVSLDVWDERLSAAGAAVMTHRRTVARHLQPHLLDAYVVVGGSGDLRWAYRSTWGSEDAQSPAELSESLSEALAARRQRDMDVRTTTVGPHRDEPGLSLDGRPTRTHASQGEQRTVALALRIGAHRLIEEVRDTPPILLLDDVFSELDHDRASRVLALIPSGQVFVTTAREDEVPISGRRWRVRDGKVV
ncbi:MAG TPA: DNA replication/repair protein RecF [Acidimicrobiia bacterium]|nr:DNA replication/repair protein RecF [Acidimicrobiia bacterium]